MTASRSHQHLAILTPTFARGGSEEYVLAMARWAVERGHAVTVCLPDVPGVDSVRRELIDTGVHVEAITAYPEFVFSDVLFLKSRSVAVHKIRALGFQRLVIVLPSIEWGGAFIDAAAHEDVPTAVIYQLVGYPYRFTDLEKSFYTWARRGRQVWATVSAQNREVLCDSLGWAHDAIDVVPNALLRPLVPPVPLIREAARASVRHEIGAPENAFVVLTVARLDRQKAFDVLLDAAAAVTARRPHVHFVWVGNGTSQPDAAALVDEKRLKGRVHLVGHRSDVPRYLQAADAFVLPSRFEGSPFATIEAMAVGLPTVLSDIGPHRELTRNGVDGLLIPVDDAAAIAQQVERLLDDEPMRMALRRAARQRSLHFSPATSFQHLFDLLERAARGNTPSRLFWPLPEPTEPSNRADSSCTDSSHTDSSSTNSSRTGSSNGQTHPPRRTRIAIYGAGAGGRRAHAERLPGVDVIAFLDSQPNRPDMLGVPVHLPEAIRDLDVDRVVVASRHHWPAMVERLRSAGWPEEKIDVFSVLRLVDPGEAEA